jgi:hypothetical protein
VGAEDGGPDEPAIPPAPGGPGPDSGPDFGDDHIDYLAQMEADRKEQQRA